jgi:hypothetical protein
VEERAAGEIGVREDGGRRTWSWRRGGTRSHGRRQGHDGLRGRRRNNEQLSWRGGRQIEGLAPVAAKCGPAGCTEGREESMLRTIGNSPIWNRTGEVNGPRMFGRFAQISLDAHAFAKNAYNGHFCAFRSAIRIRPGYSSCSCLVFLRAIEKLVN